MAMITIYRIQDQFHETYPARNMTSSAAESEYSGILCKEVDQK